MGTKGGCITSRNQTTPGRRAHRRRGEGMRVLDALRCESVQIRRGRVIVAVTTQSGAHILRGYPQDVWLVDGLAGMAKGEKSNHRQEGLGTNFQGHDFSKGRAVDFIHCRGASRFLGCCSEQVCSNHGI